MGTGKMRNALCPDFILIAQNVLLPHDGEHNP